MTARTVEFTINIQVSGKLEFGSITQYYLNKEVYVTLPDQSFMFGLIDLLEKALNCPTKILFPLNDSGDFYPDWEEAESFVEHI